MKKIFLYITLACLGIQACQTEPILDEIEESGEMVFYQISAGLPSSKDTKVIVEGDAPSSPIDVKWKGSSSDYQESFAIIGYDNDGNMCQATTAKRLLSETEDSAQGSFEYAIDYSVIHPDFDSFYALYPVREPDKVYLSGKDYDKDNWAFFFDQQTGKFEDLSKNLFMEGKNEIDANSSNSKIDFEYGIAILRLSNLSIPDLKGRSINSITIKSNSIANAISLRYSFSDYNAAGNEIKVNGNYQINDDGIINDNIYVVFRPLSKAIDYLTISLQIDGKDYSYSYSGVVDHFTKGKVYSLNNATLKHRDKSPSYDWYLNPLSENHYQIANANDFLGFAKIVNGDTDALQAVGLNGPDKFESKVIDVVNDAEIDLSDVLNSGENWTPIVDFSGTLNGNGSTVTNFFISGSFNYMGAKIGLFASLKSAKISGLKVLGTIDVNGIYVGYIGGLAAYVSSSTILNCSTELTISHYEKYGNYIGGTVGFINDSNIIGCTDSSHISIMTVTKDTDHVGGVVGYSNTTANNIIGCSHMDVELSVTAYSYLGGVVGGEGMNNLSTISACYNSGKISANVGGAGGQIHAGCGSWTSSFNISSCYYSGLYSSYNFSNGVGKVDTGSFDSGTTRVKDEASMISACDDMNAKISEWNTAHPDMECTRSYSVEGDVIVFK